MYRWALRSTACLGILIGFAFFTLSCGKVTSSVGFGSTTGTGYVFIGDAPPAGSSILKFQITLSNATLCPTVGSGGECQGTSPVSLLSAPVTIELKQLELGSAFLSKNTFATGTYAGVKLTFSNPVVKVLNTDGTIQELNGTSLPLSPVSVTPTFSTPLTVTADNIFSFVLDLDVNNSIQSSNGAITGIAPAVSLVPLSVAASQPVTDLQDTAGVVAGLTKTCPTGSFSLVDSKTGISIASIQFDGTSAFDTGLSCDTLANNQVIEADLVLQAQSQQAVQFFANRLELLNLSTDQTLRGAIVKVNAFDQVNHKYSFVLLVQEARNVAAFTDGALVTVNIDPTKAVFSIDQGTLTVDPTLFASGTDLLAGQNVEIILQNGSVVNGTNNNCAAISDACSAGALTIRLMKDNLTASVQGTKTPNFTLTSLPSVFGTFTLLRPLSADCQDCSISTAIVTTSNQTAFEGGLTSFSDLQIGYAVTVRGLLFKNGFKGPGPIGNGSPTLVASKVRLMTP